jgi:hypothetical protein
MTKGKRSSLVEYVLVIDPTLVHCTFSCGSGGVLSGNIHEQPNCVAVDSSGNAYLTGFAYFLDFPTAPGAIQPTFNAKASDARATNLLEDTAPPPQASLPSPPPELPAWEGLCPSDGSGPRQCSGVQQPWGRLIQT